MRRTGLILHITLLACLSLSSCSNDRESAGDARREVSDSVLASGAEVTAKEVKQSASKVFKVGNADTLRCGGAALYVR